LDARRIVLHSHGIAFDESSVTLEPQDGNNADARSAKGFTYDIDRDFVQIELDREFGVQPGTSKWNLLIDFKSTLDDNLRGLYTSTYVDTEGETKTLAVTQFEGIDARRAFPCFDEPEFKAIFSIAITKQRDLLVASNMNEEDSEGEGLTEEVVTFSPSLPMSTYLVALFLGEFERTPSDNLPEDVSWDFGILHQPGDRDAIQLALDSGPIILNGYEKMWEVDYPMPKLDMVAIPDFEYGGMENWGLITYATFYMIADEDTSVIDRADILETISHEISHMWFGDLVTMDWWDDLWLNEGEKTLLASQYLHVLRA